MTTTDKIRLLAYKMFEESVYARDLDEFRKSVPDNFVTPEEIHLHIDACARERSDPIVDDLHELYMATTGRNDLEKRDKWIEYMQKVAALRRNLRREVHRELWQDELGNIEIEEV